MKNLIILAAALSLSGCATKYQEMGFTGGVQANRVTSDTAQISARGNGYTDPDTIQRYAMRKAAETTLDAGFDLFEIMTTSDRSSTGRAGSAYASNGYIFGSSWDILKPVETFMIKMRKGQLPTDAPANWFDAHEVVKFLGGAGTQDNKQCTEISGKIVCE